jgi:cysteine synthase A
MPSQFKNSANPLSHEQGTAREILEQTGGKIAAFVAGVGTGGTITGVGEVLRDRMPGVRIVAVEPAASNVLSGGEPGFHTIQGWGAGFVPEILNTKVYHEVITVSDDAARACTRRLAKEEGILAGISSGGACVAALQVAERLGSGKVVVTVFPDTGERYLTTDLFHAEGI